METYLYFAENESADAASDCAVYPASTFTGIDPISATTMDLYFKSTNNMSAGGQGEVVIQDSVSLTVTTETQKVVMKAIVEAMNNGPHEDGITIIADDVNSTYLVPQIASLTSTVAAVIS